MVVFGYFRGMLSSSKKILSIFLFSLVASSFFVACEEELPPVIMKEVEKPLLDTAYQGSVPSPQTKKVLIMDITGVRCNNCPKAAKLAHQISDDNPGRVEIVALYPSTPLGLTFPWPGFDTLVTPESEQIATSLGSISSLPIGSVDQVTVGGGKLIDRSIWSNTVTNRLAVASPININLKSTWKDAEGKARVEIQMVTNVAVSGAVKYVAAVLEDGILSKQADADDTVGVHGVIDDYEHNHALRTVIGSTLGNDVGSNMPAGWVVEKHYYFTPKSKWKADNLYLVVWVYDAVSKEVYQVQKVKLKS